MTEPAVGLAYRDRLGRFASAPFPAAIPTVNLVVTVEARAEGFSLIAKVDAKEHRIVSMAANGPAGSTGLALLSGLAHVSTGRGIQDASEHAAIRLENLLRDPAVPRTVAGILQPENADPSFRTPLGLVRALYREYRAKTGYKPEWNYEDDLPSGEWMSIGEDERVRRILAALPETCPETGVRRDGIRVVGIDFDIRVTLALPAGVDPKIQQKYVTRAEAEVKSRVEPKLELYLEDVRDRNTKRHHQLGPREPGE